MKDVIEKLRFRINVLETELEEELKRRWTGNAESSREIAKLSLRERRLSVLLRKTLPILWREELSTRTNAELRDMIKQIEEITRD